MSGYVWTCPLHLVSESTQIVRKMITPKHRRTKIMRRRTPSDFIAVNRDGTPIPTVDTPRWRCMYDKDSHNFCRHTNTGHWSTQPGTLNRAYAHAYPGTPPQPAAAAPLQPPPQQPPPPPPRHPAAAAVPAPREGQWPSVPLGNRMVEQADVEKRKWKNIFLDWGSGFDIREAFFADVTTLAGAQAADEHAFQMIVAAVERQTKASGCTSS